jgi:uncharacterized protein (TIGR02246 family)
VRQPGLRAVGPATSRPSGGGRECERALDVVIAQYLGATAQRDLTRLSEVLHPGFICIFPDGEVLAGRTATVTWFRGFFADPSWTQSFRERDRVLSGCRAGFVQVDSVFAIPETGYVSNLVIGLSFTRESGRWLLIAEQNTLVSSQA